MSGKFSSILQNLHDISGKKIAIIAVVVLIAVATVPIPHSYSRSLSVAYATKSQDDISLELGDSQVAQQGADGSKVVHYDSYQNLLGYIFGTNPMFAKEVSSETDKAPLDKLVLEGTRKYQYMLCSDGGYRYFTDDQFKDKNTGFTSKSPDYCAQNNQGKKTALSDTRNGETLAMNHPSQQAQLRNNIPPGASCREENIVKHSTRYEDRSYLERGTTQVGIPGSDGHTLVCPSLIGTPHEQYARTVFPPQTEVIYRGTGKTADEIAAEKAEAESIRAQQELLTRRNEQNYLRTQCVQSLRAQGMLADRAWTECLRLYPYI